MQRISRIHLSSSLSALIPPVWQRDRARNSGYRICRQFPNILLAAHAMGLGACWTTIYPIISNLLKGKMRTIQKAYQPTIEFYTIVHSTFFVYKSSSERRIEKELKEPHNLTILYNIHFTSFSKPTFQKQRFRTQR